MKLVMATHNSHKLDEVREILLAEGLEVDLVSLHDLHYFDEIPEDGVTLEENALQKARVVHKHFGVSCFADDTGLEVEALGGAPGVHTARYAGEHCTPDDNIEKMLRELEGIEERTARFRTVIALILDGEEHLFEGAVEGEITSARSGEEGFGYDPIFRPKGYDRTFAQMSEREKNSISHRGRAIHELVEFLKHR